MVEFLSLKELDINKYDEVWLIVRSAKNCIKLLDNKKVKQITELSPNYDLFKKYLDLKHAGKWNHDAFLNIYVPDFINQIRYDDDFKKRIIELKQNPNKNYGLVCFCSDECQCHRSIVAAICHMNDIKVKTKYDINAYVKEYWHKK